jgi:hypothetical protein
MLSVFGWWYVLGVLYDHFFWKHYQALLSLFTRRAAPGADGRAVSSGHALDGLLQLLSRHARHRSAGYVTHLLLLRGMCAFYHDLCGLRRRKHTIELFATCSSLLLWVSCVDIHRGRTTHLLALICGGFCAGVPTWTAPPTARAAPKQSIHREPSARSFGAPQRSYGSTSELGTPLSVFICLLILRCSVVAVCNYAPVCCFCVATRP